MTEGGRKRERGGVRVVSHSARISSAKNNFAAAKYVNHGDTLH